MQLVIGVLLFGISATVFVAGYHAVRSANPPGWTSENMVLGVLGPVIMVFGVSGSLLIGALFVTSAGARITGEHMIEAGLVAGAFAVVWILLARRRKASMPGAQVIELPAPEQAAAVPAPAHAAQAPLKAA